MRRKISLAVESVCFWRSFITTIDAVLAEAPNTGFVYNNTEDRFLMYECIERAGTLECDFTQSSIRRKLDPRDIPKKLEEAKAGYLGAKTEFSADGGEFCKEMNAYELAINGKSTRRGKKFEEFFATRAKMSKQQLQNSNLGLAAIRNFCNSATEANYVALMKFNFDRDARTCNISVFPFKQRFAPVQGTDNWVVLQQEGPTGACGVINISRFEKDKKYSLWNYFAKKVVTNKSGQVLPDFECTSLDENEYEYSWRSREIYLGCDYITFGGF